jgi:hypothetical protein
MSKKRTGAILGAIFFAWVVYCWHWLSGADVIPFDSKLTYFQLTSWVVDCYRSWQLPLWNPYFMSGFPGCADPQIHCFYFLAIPLLALLGPLDPVWFDRVALLHILGAGIGIYFLAREFKLSAGAAAVASLIVMFGGSASARLQHTGMVYAYGLLPWCLLFTSYVVHRGKWWHVVFLGVFAGSMGVLGDQVAFLSCLTVAAFATILLVRKMVRKENFVLPLVGLLLSAVVTILLMLPQIIPTAELLPLSSRPWIPLQNLWPKSLYSWSFLTTLVPDIFRTFDGYSNYVGRNDPCETYLYFGLVPAAIFVYGGVIKGKLLRRENLRFALPLAFFLLYALGTQTPAYSFFWHFIPGVKSFQRPTDATFLVNVFIGLLTGAILDQLRAARPTATGGAEPSGPERAWFGKVLEVAVAPLLVSTAMFLALLFLCKYKVPLVLLENNWLALVKVFLFFFLGLVLVQIVRKCRNRGLQNLAVAAIALLSWGDLVWQNSSNFLNTAAHQDYAYDYPRKVKDLPGLRALAELRSSPTDPFRVELLGSSTEWQWWNASSHLHVQTTDGMWPINLLSYHQFAGACNPVFGRQFNHWTSGFDSPLFDLLNVRYVLTNLAPAAARASLREDKYKYVSSIDKYSVYENLTVVPRAFLVGKVSTAPGINELKNLLLDPHFAPRKIVYLLADDLKSAGKELSKIGAVDNRNVPGDQVLWRKYGENDVRLSVHANGNRMLVLGDIYFPGWCAEVDGQSVPIYRADFLFRAIYVSKGEHQVRFVFRPYSLDALRESTRLATQ